MLKKKSSAILLIVASVLAATISPASAATQINKPLVGKCYNYTKSDVSGDGSVKGDIKCTLMHTAETYRVGKWTGPDSPFTLTTDETWKIANSLCQPWKGQSRYFNYWAYYLPTQSQWSSGQRWIRCDGMISANEDASAYVAWKGKRLDVK
jgi:hypothetical protein